MKRTDLAKLKGKKIESRIDRAPGSGRALSPEAGRKAQRERERALGLVAFAVKLEVDLAAALRTMAQERKIDLNELVSGLLKKGMQEK